MHFLECKSGFFVFGPRWTKTSKLSWAIGGCLVMADWWSAG